MKVRQNGAWREIASARAYVSGAWRTITSGKAYYSGEWRTIVSFVSNLSLSVSPASRSNTGTTSIVTSLNFTATPTGGKSPFTYSWVKLLGGDIIIGQSTNATTSFSATVMAESESRTASFRCTVTDSLGTTATGDCSVTLTRTEGGSGTL